MLYCRPFYFSRCAASPLRNGRFSTKPDDTNTINDREKIVPVTLKIKGVAHVFSRTLDPYSVNVLQLQSAK